MAERSYGCTRVDNVPGGSGSRPEAGLSEKFRVSLQAGGFQLSDEFSSKTQFTQGQGRGGPMFDERLPGKEDC